MEIDKIQLYKDVIQLADLLKRNMSPDIIKYGLTQFESMNSLLEELSGKHIDRSIIFQDEKIIDEQTALEYMVNYYGFKYNTFFQKILEDFNLYEEIAENTIKVYLSTDFKDYVQKDNLRRFSEKDTKDILLSFFSEYGDKTYQIAKRVFEENRIQMGYHGEGYYKSFIDNSNFLQKGYICIGEDNYDTNTICTIAHEIGHLIDREVFLFPQQKKILTIEDQFLELPSKFFELEFLNFLKEQNIDKNWALSYECRLLKAVYIWEKRLLNKIREYYNNDESKFNYEDRDNFIYGMGTHIALAMSQLSRQNPKEYFKTFIDTICSRKECDLIDLLEIANINVDDFVSGEIYKKEINEKILERKKRFGYIE